MQRHQITLDKITQGVPYDPINKIDIPKPRISNQVEFEYIKLEQQTEDYDLDVEEDNVVDLMMSRKDMNQLDMKHTYEDLIDKLSFEPAREKLRELKQKTIDEMEK